MFHTGTWLYNLISFMQLMQHMAEGELFCMSVVTLLRNKNTSILKVMS